MPLSHSHSCTPICHHAHTRAIASLSPTRASGMHTSARWPHTPCGPSACVSPATFGVPATHHIPPQGVTPPSGVRALFGGECAAMRLVLSHSEPFRAALSHLMCHSKPLCVKKRLVSTKHTARTNAVDAPTRNRLIRTSLPAGKGAAPCHQPSAYRPGPIAHSGAPTGSLAAPLVDG